MASKMSNDNRAEGLESRNHNIAHGVRILRSRCVTFDAKVLTSGQAQQVELGESFSWSLDVPLSWISGWIELADSRITQDAGGCTSSL